MDIFPGLSQGKSFVQWVSGDSAGARETQSNFLRGCPGFSQGYSAVQSISGDQTGAYETQVYCMKSLGNVVDGIPVIGHAKGGVHYMVGDTEGGHSAMKSASRSTGVIGGGVGGFLVGGPPGAIAGGIGGGALMDGTITGVESAVHGQYRPYGYVDTGTRIYNGQMSSGDYYDAAGGLLFDGLGGRGAGKLTRAVRQNRTFKAAIPESSANMSKHSTSKLMKSQAQDLQKVSRGVGKNVADYNPKGKTSTILIDENLRQHKGYSHGLRRHMSTGGENPFPGGTSRLQATLPDARSVGRRQLNACAEHQAYQSVPGGTKVRAHTSLQLEGNGRQVYPVGPCNNCSKYGTTIGDSITRPMDRGRGALQKNYVPDKGARIKATSTTSSSIVNSQSSSRRRNREDRYY